MFMELLLYTTLIYLLLFVMAQQPLVRQDLLITEASQSHWRHIILGRTPVDEWSALRRHLCLTTHNTQNRQTSMSPAGFETTILPSERQQTHPRLRSRVHRDRHFWIIQIEFLNVSEPLEKIEHSDYVSLKKLYLLLKVLNLCHWNNYDKQLNFNNIKI
jgi:hypothetical protein